MRTDSIQMECDRCGETEVAHDRAEVGRMPIPRISSGWYVVEVVKSEVSAIAPEQDFQADLCAVCAGDLVLAVTEFRE